MSDPTPAPLSIDWKSPKIYAGAVTLLSTYIQTNPAVMDELAFPPTLKAWVWNITKFTMWVAGGGYMLLQFKGTTPPPAK